MLAPAYFLFFFACARSDRWRRRVRRAGGCAAVRVRLPARCHPPPPPLPGYRGHPPVFSCGFPRSRTPVQRCGNTFESSASFPRPPHRWRRRRQRHRLMAAGRRGVAVPARFLFFFSRLLPRPHLRRASPPPPVTVMSPSMAERPRGSRPHVVWLAPTPHACRPPSLPVGLARRGGGSDAHAERAEHQLGAARQRGATPIPSCSTSAHRESAGARGCGSAGREKRQRPNAIEPRGMLRGQSQRPSPQQTAARR